MPEVSHRYVRKSYLLWCYKDIYYDGFGHMVPTTSEKVFSWYRTHQRPLYIVHPSIIMKPKSCETFQSSNFHVVNWLFLNNGHRKIRVHVDSSKQISNDNKWSWAITSQNENLYTSHLILNYNVDLTIDNKMVTCCDVLNIFLIFIHTSR